MLHDVVAEDNIKTRFFERYLVQIKMHIGNWRNEVGGQVVEVFLSLESIDEALLWGHVQYRERWFGKEVAVVFEVEPHEPMTL